MQRRLKHWGWGYEDEQPSHEELVGTARFLRERLGFGSLDPREPVPLAQLSLPEPRLRPPESLEPICRTSDYERALHAYGRSYSDIVRAFRGASTIRPTSSPTRATRPRSRRCSSGRSAPAQR